MKTHQTFVKVRYAETDQMGVVHHGNYAQYLEMARIDWLAQFDVSYRQMEKDGIMLPVYSMEFTFLKPAAFDDVLKIETRLKSFPTAKIEFDYTIHNQEEELLTKASTTLVFMDANSKRPMRCPQYILDKIKED
jgi:acyl-CoA thioester hydrolase